jgi:two-component system, sensor histidine kinase PdtaS
MKKILFNLSFSFFVVFTGWSQQKKTTTFEEQIKKNIEIASEYIDNDNDSSQIYIQKAKDLSKKLKQPLFEVKILETEGNYYGFVKNDYNNATNLYLKAAQLCEKHRLDYTKNLYHSLGVLFHLTDNYEKAKYYYSKALPLEEKHRDTLLMVRSLVNLASVYSSQGNYKLSESLFKKSLTFNSTLAIKRATYSNLGNLKIRDKKYKEALKYLNIAVSINDEEFGDNIIDISFLLDAKREATDFEGLDTLLPYCERLIDRTTDLRNKTILVKALSSIYHKTENYKRASELKDIYILEYDSLKAEQRDEVVYEMETKYQTQKKEEEIVKQQKEKNKLRLFFIIACLTIALLSFLVYQFFKQRNRLKKQTQLLETAVDEKNILLKETHHRVKNSFQIVSSLLYLQSENMKDKEAALAVKEAQNRVKSMVLIHQKLYSKDQLIGIETKEYIEDLVNDIIENQTDTIPNLTTNVAVESTVFSIDSITPLGLIINELITNCIKHAFSSSVENPKIELEFKKQGEIYVLKVIDNGIGFSNEISENSFGIKLINALAKKLKGKITFENKNGTHFVMEIHKFEQMN